MLVVSNYWESIEMIISNLVFSYQTNSKLSWICLEHFCIMSLLQSQISFKRHEYILFCKGVRVMVFIVWELDLQLSNYISNQCLSSLTLWVRIPLRQGVLDTTLCDKVCQWLAAGLWFKLSWICLEHFCIMSLLQSQIYFKRHEYILFCKGVRVMVFIATFNNISVILWQSVFFVEKTGENHWPAASHW
jgi:hypothetical protein